MTWISTFLLQLIFALAGQSSEVFKIKLEDMKSRVASGKIETLEEALKTEGALAVTGLPHHYGTAVKRLKIAAPGCLEEEGLPQFELPDGSLRRTFARSTSQPVEFPQCVRKECGDISDTFDEVYHVVAKLFTKVAGENNLNWRTTDEKTSGNLSSLLQKEHIHVYRPPRHISHQEDYENYVVPYHYDSGLLLMVTSFAQHPLLIKNKEGDLVSTAQVGDDGILVLVARGLTDWLLEGTPSSSKFYPAPHAVPSLTNEISSRTVFARMKVVPMDALPLRINKNNRKEKYQTFGEFFNDMSPRGDMDLCPIIRPLALALQLAWEDLKSDECVGNTAYCWMNCLQIPQQCGASSSSSSVSSTSSFSTSVSSTSSPSRQNATCKNSKNQPCCTHPDHTDNCANMDSTCAWSCPAVQAAPPPTETERPFCNGYGTSMYMNGFQVSGKEKNSCVILLFESWVLNTRMKFIFACIGVILLGIVIEYMLYARRQVQANKILLGIRNPARKIIIVFLFAMNIVLGYSAMLVAMTYSVELLICIVVGLIVGHALFNTSAPVGESADPCCASQVLPPPKQGEC